jgi:thiol-disulfide isomerase/thioredoxin
MSRIWIAGAAVVAMLHVAVAAQQPPPNPSSPGAAALQRGEVALRARAFQPALDAFKEAKKLEAGLSALACYGMGRAYHGLKAFKDEAAACAEGLKHTDGDRPLESLLHNQLGMALFAHAVAGPDSRPIGWYNLGVLLLKQNRDDEGKEALARYLEGRPVELTEVELARGMIADPRRAREPLAPDFTIVDDAGDTVGLKDLAGKTVLLDFWGTWCGPCRAATPVLVRLNKQFAAQAFAMIGISSDSPRDRQVWQKYIEVNKMPWFQYLDLDRRIHRLFGVTVFPSYVIVGPDGMVRDRLEGFGPTAGMELEGKIKKSLKSAAAK